MGAILKWMARLLLAAAFLINRYAEGETRQKRDAEIKAAVAKRIAEAKEKADELEKASRRYSGVGDDIPPGMLKYRREER
jgi:hypothetical protein